MITTSHSEKQKGWAKGVQFREIFFIVILSPRITTGVNLLFSAPLPQYCNFSQGVVFASGLQQLMMFGGSHAVFLFWAVVFPFSFRQLKLSGRMRYAHIISVILGILVPLPAGLTQLKDGYAASFTPTILCVGRNRDYTYYAFVLPSCIIMCTVSCLLVIIIWTIFKVT